MKTFKSQQGADSVIFRALIERSGPVLACRLVVSAVSLGPDEFAGMVLGYLGSGTTQLEPFHIRFEKERATYLLIGDVDALRKRTRFFETSPLEARRAVTWARQFLAAHCEDTTEGVWRSCDPVRLPIRWLKGDSDCALIEQHTLDERLWVHISAHLGVPAGLET